MSDPYAREDASRDCGTCGQPVLPRDFRCHRLDYTVSFLFFAVVSISVVCVVVFVTYRVAMTADTDIWATVTCAMLCTLFLSPLPLAALNTYAFLRSCYTAGPSCLTVQGIFFRAHVPWGEVFRAEIIRSRFSGDVTGVLLHLGGGRRILAGNPGGTWCLGKKEVIEGAKTFFTVAESRLREMGIPVEHLRPWGIRGAWLSGSEWRLSREMQGMRDRLRAKLS